MPYSTWRGLLHLLAQINFLVSIGPLPTCVGVTLPYLQSGALMAEKPMISILATLY